jgi:hypothetical protein
LSFGAPRERIMRLIPKGILRSGRGSLFEERLASTPLTPRFLASLLKDCAGDAYPHF